MIDYFELENRIQKNNIENCYILCGVEENLILKSINEIKDKFIDEQFKTLNYLSIDGNKITIDSIINSCETVPFMSEKKMVVVYNANFFKDKRNSSEEKLVREIKEYINNIPNHCILIFYYVFENKREKISRDLFAMQNNVCIVKFDKLRGKELEKKVEALFRERNKKINKSDLYLFCNRVNDNLNIITNEVEKLCCYVKDREITKEDIILLTHSENENDIFNMVDFLSQKKIEKAIDILNDLIFKGEKVSYILRMIERQFKLLLLLKCGMESGMDKQQLSKKYKLNEYICSKMMLESKKFKKHQLINCLNKCIDTERKIKTSSVNGKMEIETLIVSMLIG